MNLARRDDFLVLQREETMQDNLFVIVFDFVWVQSLVNYQTNEVESVLVDGAELPMTTSTVEKILKSGMLFVNVTEDSNKVLVPEDVT